MRVTTAFKRLLRLPGASDVDVAFGAEGIVVAVRLRRRRRVCALCGQTGQQLHIHDRRIKRWRHLDVGANRCVIECELRRLRCPVCGVRLEPVPRARPGARHTRDFEDVVVRHEAPLNRVGCRAPPSGCRSSSVKRGQPDPGDAGSGGSSPDKAGTGQHRQMVGVRRARQGGVTQVNQHQHPVILEPARNLVDLGRDAALDRRQRCGGRLRQRHSLAAWEAAGKACGVLAAMLPGHSWAPILSNGQR